MENLIEKVSSLVGKGMRKATLELSYQTGIGWKYLPEDEYHDRMSRNLQRNNCSPNNHFVRAVKAGYF